jgi:hypothetical protein
VPPTTVATPAPAPAPPTTVATPAPAPAPAPATQEVATTAEVAAAEEPAHAAPEVVAPPAATRAPPAAELAAEQVVTLLQSLVSALAPSKAPQNDSGDTGTEKTAAEQNAEVSSGLSSVVHRLSVALADEEEAAAIAESLRTTAEAVGDQTEADHATHNHAMVRAACRVLESELPVAFG